MKVLLRARHIAAALALTTALLLWPGAPRAQTHPSLSKARQEYVNQNHAEVVKLVKPLLEPKSILGSEAEEADAYKLLGLSYWWLKDYKASEAAFLSLLSMRPRYKIKKAVHGEGVWKFFNKVKKKFERTPTELRKRQREELNRCRKTLKSTRRERDDLRKRCLFRLVQKKKYRPRWLSFVPFGVGQFANGQHTKGWIFFSLETALALTNVTAHIMGQTNWAYDGSGSSKRVNVDRARALQITQIVSGSLFLAAVGVGIIDALVNWKPAETRELKVPIEKPKPSKVSRFHILPSVGPGGGGVTLSLDF